MNEATLTPEQSLQIIQNMIGKTKAGFTRNSHYFLLWGWLTFAAMTGQYILKVWMHAEQHYQVWWLMPLGLVITIIMGRRQKNNRRIRTYVDDSIRYLWTTLGITFLVLTLILNFGKVNYDQGLTWYILLYAIGTTITGRLIKFWPLVAGGALCWGLAFATVFTDFDGDLLLGALAILVSYIIPGHLLRLKKY